MFEILIVEDAPDQAKVLSAALTQEGFTIRVFGDGASAMTALDERLPDFALLDVNTPDGDGYDVCRAIRRREPADRPVTVVMVTARNDTASKLLAFAAGADDYLVKPIDVRELRSRVARWLESRSVLADVVRRRRHDAIQELVGSLHAEVEAPLDDVIRSLDVMLDRDALTEALRRDIHDVRGRLLGIVKGLRRITPP